MPMSEADAALQADNMLRLLIENQAQTFVTTTNDMGGRNLGDAIAALRLKLIEMYKTQP